MFWLGLWFQTGVSKHNMVSKTCLFATPCAQAKHVDLQQIWRFNFLLQFIANYQHDLQYRVCYLHYVANVKMNADCTHPMMCAQLLMKPAPAYFNAPTATGRIRGRRDCAGLRPCMSFVDTWILADIPLWFLPTTGNNLQPAERAAACRKQILHSAKDNGVQTRSCAPGPQPLAHGQALESGAKRQHKTIQTLQNHLLKRSETAPEILREKNTPTNFLTAHGIEPGSPGRSPPTLPPKAKKNDVKQANSTPDQQ